MNLVEHLSREIERVSVIREHYRSLLNRPRVEVRPQIAMMTLSIENAQRALGLGDIEAMMAASKDLGETTE